MYLISHPKSKGLKRLITYEIIKIKSKIFSRELKI